MSAAPAYDLWSRTYDDQPDNPLLFLDDELLDSLLESVDLRAKTIVDVGCGTGRHWRKLLDREPRELIGYDVSSGMLARLCDKFPRSTVYRPDGYLLAATGDASCDLVISTLVLGYLAEIDAALAEWSRILRPGGDMIITDMHPDAAATAERGFHHEAASISIRHYVHPLASLQRSAAAHHLDLVRIDEKVINDSIKRFYETANALALFDKVRGTRLMYGIHFKKSLAAVRLQ